MKLRLGTLDISIYSKYKINLSKVLYIISDYFSYPFISCATSNLSYIIDIEIKSKDISNISFKILDNKFINHTNSPSISYYSLIKVMKIIRSRLCL